jgi:hypothetical protein
MDRLGLIVVAAALAGCAPASPYATTAYCTPAGLRTTPTAALGGLVGAVNALPAAGVCRARSTQGDTAPTPPSGGGATPSTETPAPTK